MEERIDNAVINSTMALEVVVSVLIRLVLKTRNIIFVASLVLLSLFCFDHSIDQTQNASPFTWAGLLADLAAVVLVVKLLTSEKIFPFHECEHVDHKNQPKDGGWHASI